MALTINPSYNRGVLPGSQISINNSVIDNIQKFISVQADERPYFRTQLIRLYPFASPIFQAEIVICQVKSFLTLGNKTGAKIWVDKAIKNPKLKNLWFKGAFLAETLTEMIGEPMFTMYGTMNRSPPTHITMEVVGKLPGYQRVPISFVAPKLDENGNAVVDVSFICGLNYGIQISCEWIRQASKNGKHILGSVQDTDKLPWNLVNKKQFAKSYMAFAKEWGLSGIDIDVESNMDPSIFAENYIELINALSEEGGPNFIMSYVAYIPERDCDPILSKVGKKVHYVATMDYGNESIDDKMALLNNYAKWVPKKRCSPGVKTGTDNIDFVKQLTAYCNNHGYGLPMLWSIDWDTPLKEFPAPYKETHDLEYFEAIHTV